MKTSKKAAEQLKHVGHKQPKADVGDIQKQIQKKREKEDWLKKERHKRKMELSAAQAADADMLALCDQMVQAANNVAARRKEIHDLREQVNKLKEDSQTLDERIKSLQRQWRDKRKAYGELKTELHALENKDNEIVKARAELQAALNQSMQLWRALPPHMRKKDKQHRAAKKQAKKLLK